MRSVESAQPLPKWDLSSLYARIDDPHITRDLNTLSVDIQRFVTAHKGKIAGIAAGDLSAAIKSYEHIQDGIGRLMSYAYLEYATHLSDDRYTQFFQNISEQINDLSTQLLFFTLEINHLEEAQLELLLAKDKALAFYQPWLRDVRSFRLYQLSDELETLLSEKSVTGRAAWNRLFDETLAGLTFPFKKEQLSASGIFNRLSSHDASERKQAAASVSKTLSNHIRTFAFITNTLAKDKAIEDKWRKFPAPISSRNVANLIEDDVVEALIQSVKQNYGNLSHRYYRLKAKWFGKKQLNYWDRNAPLPDEAKTEYSYSQAQQLILEAFGEFSPKMAAITEQFFSKNWIDVPPYDGKESGAFSHPTVPSANPFILVNFQGKIRDVMTLAHELGHGIHQFLSRGQGALMADTPLTLAETASVFGEQLTFRKLLAKESSAKGRKVMIASKVEDMLNTVVRQVAFCEFERLVHDARKAGEVPVEQLNKLWLQVQSESLGKAIKLNPGYEVYWSYIPHFIHSPFYVYSYAFGDCLVNALYKRYQEKPQGFEALYLDALSSGGTRHHKQFLAPFGLDATNPSFWQMGLDVVAGFIDELEAI